MLRLFHSIRELDIKQLADLHFACMDDSDDSGVPMSIQNSCQLQAEQDFYTYLHTFFSVYHGIYALWVVDGRYCSSLRLEQYHDGYLLTSLETAPVARRKGYATSLVKSVISYLSQTNCDKLYAHIDIKNVASLSVHTRCGFSKILDHAVYLDGSVYTNSCTFCYELKKPSAQ